MEGMEHRATKEALPEISIEQYSPEDKAALIAGVGDIQEIERNLSDTRRPGSEMAEEYFANISKEVVEKSGAIFVAKSDNKVVGFVVCWIEREHDLIQTDESNIYGFISDAWVDADLRDRGLFAQLNAKVEEHVQKFPEAHFIRMNVVSDNERAKAAYVKMGYAPEEIIMAKRVAPAKTETDWTK